MVPFDAGLVIVLVLGAAFVGFLVWAEVVSRRQRLRAGAGTAPAGQQPPQPSDPV